MEKFIWKSEDRSAIFQKPKVETIERIVFAWVGKVEHNLTVVVVGSEFRQET
jgi:hypothetical protein